MRRALCHPERRHYGHGLCAPCCKHKRWVEGVAARPRKMPRGMKPRPSTLALPEDPRAIGYLAGLLDGEGTIRLRHANQRASWTVSIANTNADIMALLAKVGGNVYPKKQSSDRFAVKPLFDWHLVRATDIKAFLTALFPLLIEKKVKAAKALEDIDSWLESHDYKP